MRLCTKECVFLHLVLLYETANMNMKMYKDVGIRSILLVSCQTSWNNFEQIPPERHEIQI